MEEGDDAYLVRDGGVTRESTSLGKRVEVDFTGVHDDVGVLDVKDFEDGIREMNDDGVDFVGARDGLRMESSSATVVMTALTTWGISPTGSMSNWAP